MEKIFFEPIERDGVGDGEEVEIKYEKRPVPFNHWNMLTLIGVVTVFVAFYKKRSALVEALPQVVGENLFP